MNTLTFLRDEDVKGIVGGDHFPAAVLKRAPSRALVHIFEHVPHAEPPPPIPPVPPPLPG